MGPGEARANSEMLNRLARELVPEARPGSERTGRIPGSREGLIVGARGHRRVVLHISSALRAGWCYDSLSAGISGAHSAESSDDRPTRSNVHAPSFPDNLDWIDTGGRQITLADLRGKIVLLDFWTYG